MKEVRLSQGLVALVDDDDFDMVSAYSWCVRKDGNTHYAVGGGVYKGVDTRRLMHRLILGVSSDAMVDHKDGNGLNCQKSNLRLCTNAQNQYNQPKRRGTTSKYKGVRLKEGKYEAQIRTNLGRKYLGRFTQEADAAEAYNKAALIYHGEFANLNTI